MKLRTELEPKIEIVENLFPIIIELLTVYDDAYDNNDREKIETAINQINILTNKNIAEEDLFEYWEAESKEDLALKYSIPYPNKVDNITIEELLEIIKRIQSFDDNEISEKLSEFCVSLSSTVAYEFYLPLLKRNYSYPEPFKLFQSQKINGKFVEFTTNEIAEKILSHKAIEL